MEKILRIIRWTLDRELPLSERIGSKTLSLLFRDRHTRLRSYAILVKKSLVITLWLDWQDYTHASYLLRRYEDEVVNFLERTLGKGDLFVDAGANVGYFSIIAAKLGARVVSVEPMSANLLSLKKNIRSNGVDVRLEQVALDSKEGKATLKYKMLNSGSPSIVGMFGPEEQIDAYMKEEVVKTKRLEQIVGSPCKVLKMDIQGAELDVLRASETLLRSRRIEYILVEYNSNTYGRELLDLLVGYGYTPYEIAADGSLRNKSGDLANKANYVFATPGSPGAADSSPGSAIQNETGDEARRLRARNTKRIGRFASRGRLAQFANQSHI